MSKLSFRKYGEGEPLIILHGLYGSSDNWVTIARELMQNFTVYIIDLRNHGNSPHLPEHNYSVMTDDLVEFMNDNSIYSAIIMGHSMGGKVAMFFTAYYPERVKKLIVVDISPRTYDIKSGDKQFYDHTRIINALSSIDLEKLESRDEADRILAESIASDRIRQFLLKNLARKKDKGYVWKINLEVLKNNLFEILKGLEEEAMDLKLFKNPVLFIKGEQSDYINSKDIDFIGEIFYDANMVTIKNASHWVHAEQPTFFIKTINEFILN